MRHTVPWAAAAALALLGAAPLAAQDNSSPPCRARAGELTVNYDRTRHEVTLVGVTPVASTPQPSGTLSLFVVFVDNGREEADQAWGERTFAYVNEGATIRLTTRFAGRTNAEQILGDLSRSRRLALLDREGVLFNFDLAGIGPEIARLRRCAA